MSALAALFPAQDYGFRLTLKRGVVGEFFARSDRATAVLAERRGWLAQTPHDFVIDAPELAPVWREVALLIGARGESALALGRDCECDLVLLQRDAGGVFRVQGGVVVFPTSWSLPEKRGLTLAEAHGVVPGLNPAIGAAIDRFLERLKPDSSAGRSNWGFAASPELNLHPGLDQPRLTAATGLDHVWLRVEHQILTALAESGAILFGIRIALHPLAEVLADAEARRGLHRALQTMPEPVAHYKGLSDVRSRLLVWCR